MEAVAARLERRPDGPRARRQPRRQQGLARTARATSSRCCARLGPLCDFATVNVSSPNTERLRDLQGRDALAALLGRVMEARAALPRRIPVFLKIAPDLTDAEIADVAEVAEASGLDGIVATNTTLARDGLPRRRTGTRRAASRARRSSTRSTRGAARGSRGLTGAAADRRGRDRLGRGRLGEDRAPAPRRCSSTPRWPIGACRWRGRSPRGSTARSRRGRFADGRRGRAPARSSAG